MINNLIKKEDKKADDTKKKRKGIVRQIFFVDYTLPKKEQQTRVLFYNSMRIPQISVLPRDRAYDKLFTISENGNLESSLSRYYEKSVVESVLVGLYLLSINPEKMAQNYSEKTGKCCFCKLPLKDKHAIAHGYGKICARKLYLPW
jgi:hypothetical protein